MQIVAALLALGFGLSFAYGWACWLLPYKRRGWMILSLTTFALSLGWLTLLMFWIALIWPGRLGLIPILGAVLVLSLAGLWLKREDLKPASLPADTLRAMRNMGPAETILVAIVILTCAGILFNSVYWPFGDEDALAIYAPIAKEIFQTGTLPIGLHLYEGYPALVQMAYAYTHWAYGGVNEYLARLVPALMAVGTVGVVAVLGREMRSIRVGIFAAGLTAMTPFFCRWASSGNVDVPGSFYFSLSALFAWRWWRDGGDRNAILTGAAAGFAMWTKNDALILLVSLGILVGVRLWVTWTKGAESRMAHEKWDQIAWLTAAILATAGPWYVRNVIVFHFILPPTLWADVVQHTFGRLLSMVWAWQDFGVPGVLFSAAILFASARIVRRVETDARSMWVMLLAVVMPFYGAWWWLASYDIRFLVMIVPLLAVMAGLMLDEIILVLSELLPPVWFHRAGWIAVFCILALAPFSLRKTINYKGTILSQPLISDAQKHRIVLGGIYDLALAINRLPPRSRVVGVPSVALYHIDLKRFDAVSGGMVDISPGELTDNYDYVVYKFSDSQVPSWFQEARPLLQTQDGYFLYAVGGRGAATP